MHRGSAERRCANAGAGAPWITSSTARTPGSMPSGPAPAGVPVISSRDSRPNYLRAIRPRMPRQTVTSPRRRHHNPREVKHPQ